MPQTSNINKALNDLLSTSQRKSYFVGFVTVLFILVMVLAGILPAYSAFTFQNEENNKRDEAIDKLTSKLETTKGLTKEMEDKQPLIDYFNEVFPSVASQDSIVSLVNTLVNSNNVYFVRLSFKESDANALAVLNFDPNVGAQDASVVLEGSRDNLLNFVKDLEQSRRILNLNGLSVDRKSDEQLKQEENKLGDYNMIVQFQ